MPHLSSLLWYCFLLSIWTVLGRGSGEGGDTWISTSAAAILNWILVWMILEQSIRKLFCTALYKGNGLSMPYLQLLLYIWLAISVCRTYICLISIILCFFKTEEEEKRNVTVLYLFQPQQHLFVNTFFVHVHAYNITIVWRLDLVNYVSTTSISQVSVFILFSLTILFKIFFWCKTILNGLFQKI